MSIHLSVCPSPKLKNIIKSLYNQHQDIKSHQVDNQLWSTIDWDWQSTIDWDWQLSEINNHLINNWLRSTIDWYWQMTEINFSSIYCDFLDFSSCSLQGWQKQIGSSFCQHRHSFANKSGQVTSWKLFVHSFSNKVGFH